MSKVKFQDIEVDIVNLILDQKNPRFEEQENQREALKTISMELGQKLVRIAEHIAQNGLNPSELPIVLKSKGKNQYIVKEGNRRIAAIKLGIDPKLAESLGISPSLIKSFKRINKTYGSELPLSIRCAVAPTETAAKKWIDLKHTGENGGIGVIQWTGLATARSKGASPENQLLEMVYDSGFLDEDTIEKSKKISITNLERILKTTDARKALGIDLKKKKLIITDKNSANEIIGRLAILVSDITNKFIKVTQLDTKEQRIEYAKAVAKRETPGYGQVIKPTIIGNDNQQSHNNTGGKRKDTRQKKRNTLIPKSCKLNITQDRINGIYSELQRLKIEDFENSCAILLRVFLEMSLNEYGKINKLTFKKERKQKDGKIKSQEYSLKEKLFAVIEWMEKNYPDFKKELHSVRTTAGTENTIFSIANWHQYVHNEYYNPVVGDLKKIWDNFQPFFKKLWA